MSDKGTASQRRGTGLLPAGIIITALVAIALFITFRDDSETSDAPAGSQSTLPQPQETAPGEATDAAEPEEMVEQEDAVTAPTVDEVRVDGTGTMVIAGRGEPGAEVDVIVDGEIVASVEVDGGGAFAALTRIPESDGARSLTLRSGEGEEAIASKGEIILAPVTPLPAETAEARADTTGEVSTPSEAPANGNAPVDVARDDTDKPVAEVAGVEPVADSPAEVAPDPPSLRPTRAPDTETADGASTSDDEGSADIALAAEDPALSAEGDAPAAEPQADQNRQIAVLRSDEDGVTLIQPAAPVPERVVLDTIAYNDDGVVQLAGRASGAAAQVQIYLNDRPVERFEVRQGGAWRGTVRDVAPGVYRLRVDALTAEGRVASRLETPFKREAPAVLAAAATETQGPGAVRAVTVQAGDTLWAIARERYGEGLLYVQVFEANRAAIREPDLIYPGQVFELPDN
ncbi:MAG: LysM peptidoglycan-binding domain-containing protein [Pseudomonadota bacterium]